MIGSAKAISDWIKDHDDIAVITHIRPDGDAFGSALALTFAIRALGKRAFAACDDKADKKYLFLPEIDGVSTVDNMPFMPKAVLSADVSEKNRMGKWENVFDNTASQALLDHHATNPGFAGTLYIDENAASTGELAMEVIKELGVKLTKDIAVCLFTAISTDCGNFSFQNTTPRAYISTAECVEAGADVEELTRRLYRTRSYEKTRLMGLALSRIELNADGKVASVAIDNEMFKEAGAEHSDTNSIVNYLNEIEGVEIGFTAEEIEGGVKFSFRAAGGANVASLAKEFGGGGHIAAAGATVMGVSIKEIYPKAIEAAVRHARGNA
ncbi:MAG: DHH family phosphoesterase [Clostridia bacterium]|nr:DHH family phosphoesterase [Clostridia bacterium]